MKKNTNISRDDKRRLLLNKKYNDNIQANEGNFARPDGTVVRAAMTKRMRAIIAVIVALCIAVPSLTVFIARGSTKTFFTELDSENPATNQVLSNTYTGTVYYYYQPDDRTYTYNLRDTRLVPGDKITFNETTKTISWIHDGSNSLPSGAVNISPDLMTLNETASSDTTFVFDLKSEKALEPDTTYYYDSGSDCYIFTVGEFVGYKASNATSTSDQSSRDYYMQDPLKNSEGIQLTIDASNADNVTATVTGAQFTRHTVYVQVDNLSPNGIYLITKKTGSSPEVMVKYATSKNNSSIFDSYNCDTFVDNWVGTDYPHSVYDISNSNVIINVANAEQVDAFVYSADDIQIGVGDKYIDAAEQASTSFLESCPNILPEFQAQATNLTGTNLTDTFYLAAYDGNGNAGSIGKYTTKKVLGSIYNNGAQYYQNAYVYDLCTEQTRYNRVDYHHNYGSTWTYGNSQLQNYAFELGSSQYYFLGTYNGQNGLSRVANSAAAGETNIYQMQNIYAQKDVNDENDVIVDSDDSGALPAEGVSYTDSSVDETNGLNINKTVSGSNGNYNVTLEAYTTGSSLNQPATDIVLVLDQSKYMSDDVMFKRDYENLNTYTAFSDIDLTVITHDALFDNDTNPDQSGGILSWLTTKIASLFRDRKYIHNKYIEDPHHPGQYVYLYQKYSGSWSWSNFTYTNSYTYYFTDCDGVEYESKVYTQRLTETALSGDTITQIEFHKASDPNQVNDTVINKMYYITDMYGESDNTASTLNSSLKTKADAGNLYMKDSDGTFRKVFITESGGMYTYYVTDNDQASGTRLYEATQGGVTNMVGGNAGKKTGLYGVYQGFREYIRKGDDLALDPENNNYLSKSLYEYKGRDAVSVTAEQVMKESLEDFLLNAHEQALAKSAEVHVALVVYAHGAEVKFTLEDGANNKTNMKKPIGTNSVDSMVSAIYNYDCTADGLVAGNKASYASETNLGMSSAYNEMKSYKHDKTKTINNEVVTTPSRKYTLLFTAGVPAAYTSRLFGLIDTSGTYTISTASGAVSNAFKLKNELNTTIYSVGLFDNANETKINGSKWYYEWSSTVPCSGEVGSYWGGSWVSSALNYNIDPKDAYATNRMLAYISSDYSSPTQIGLNRGWYHPGKNGLFSGLAGGYGYQITSNFTRNELGYYLSVSPKNLNEDVTDENAAQSELSATEVQTILSDVFKKLEVATAVPNSTLDGKAYLVDGITKYFDFDGSSISDITVEVQEEDGNLDTSLTQDLTVTLSEDKKTIAVKGFSYKDHYIIDEDSTEAPSASPRKLVVSFDITRAEGLIGGNNIPTNLTESAIYDGDPKVMAETDSQGNHISPYGVLVERFEIPKVDLDIEMTHIVKNDSAYYGCEENLADLIDLTDLTPDQDSEIIPNEFVNIEYTFYEASDTNKQNPINTYTIPAGGTVGVWSNPIQAAGTGEGQNYQPGAVSQDNLNSIFQQIYNTTDYTVDCTVKPVTKGTVPNTPIVNNGNVATVYVFKPHYDVHNDIVPYAGAGYPLNDIPELSWIGYDASGAELTGNDKTEAEELLEPKSEPSISYDLYDKRLSTVAMDNASSAEYPIATRTDFQMQNLVLTPTPIEYEVEQLVAEIQYVNSGVIYSMTTYDSNGDPEATYYYDENGNEIPGATTGRELGTFEDEEGETHDEELLPDKEKVFGSVFKTLQRTTTPGTLTYEGDNPTVTFMNTTSGDDRTNGEFTISLRSHDVTIVNHTVQGQPDADYSDPNKEFPLTLSLKDGNNNVPNGTTVQYSKNGVDSEQPLTFNNGQAVIYLKDGDTVMLKEIIDGYNLTVTSNPSDNYYFYYKTGDAETDFDEVDPISTDEDEKTAAITISDDMVIDLTHTVHEIVITGRGAADSKLNPFFIAAAIVALLGGSGTAYAVKRKSETEA